MVRLKEIGHSSFTYITANFNSSMVRLKDTDAFIQSIHSINFNSSMMRLKATAVKRTFAMIIFQCLHVGIKRLREGVSEREIS